MPTKKRITVPGALSHIMARGIDGLTLFREDVDRHYFLDRLAGQLARTSYICYGWVLMSNHYHLVLRCSERPLDEVMRVVNSQYAKYFNGKYSRHGYLFQDRFKSIVTQDQRYLEELIRYVHLNPLRAGICKSIEALDDYPWCGHSVIMGNGSCSFQETRAIMRRFGTTTELARKRYREFIESGIKSNSRDWIVETVRDCNRGVERKDRPGCWVLGDREFVVSVMRKNNERLQLRSVLRQAWSIEQVFDRLTRKYGCISDEVKKRSRLTTASTCKRKGAYICCGIIGYPVIEVASYLGVSGPAVSWMVKNGEAVIDKSDVDLFTNLPPG
jgi:REP element-mobilizing transposase RayT